jgi:hypothetical protein
MKKNMFRYPVLLGMLATLFLVVGCDKEDEDNMYTLRGSANGTQEVPTRVTTTATGNITGTYNRDNNNLQYTITWSGLTGGNPSAMHFHGPADPGVAASVLIPITGFPATASGTVTGSADLSDDQETELLNGRLYYNIHNAVYPAGEIRGQVFAIRD